MRIKTQEQLKQREEFDQAWEEIIEKSKEVRRQKIKELIIGWLIILLTIIVPTLIAIYMIGNKK